MIDFPAVVSAGQTEEGSGSRKGEKGQERSQAADTKEWCELA